MRVLFNLFFLLAFVFIVFGRTVNLSQRSDIEYLDYSIPIEKAYKEPAQLNLRVIKFFNQLIQLSIIYLHNDFI